MSDKPQDRENSKKAESGDGKRDEKKGGSKAKGKKSEKTETKKIPVVVPSKDFELEKYTDRYEGHTRVARLLFIAERYPDKQNVCYKLAIEELKKGRNTSQYRKLFETVPDKLSQAGINFDSSWADGVDKSTAIEGDSLENDLQNHKTNQNRKKIRVCANYIKSNFTVHSQQDW
jgi:COP9 signalosome complex subunit 1